MARKDPRRNITRIKNPLSNDKQSLGWLVRFQNRRQRHVKFFSDQKWGGNRGALNAAKQYRDEIERQLEPFSVEELAASCSVRNSSGMVGVRRHRQVDIRNGVEYYYDYWVAQWIDGQGHRKTRMFSINQHGNRLAKQLAQSTRKQGVRRAKR